MLSLTLDTNCIIDLQKDRSNDFRFAMEKLLQLAESGQLDLAVTTRVEGETKYPSTFEAYRALIDSGRIRVIASTTRLGFWRLGIDVLPDENLWKRIAETVFPEKDPETLFRPQGELPSGAIDVDHLYGHACAARNFFVTRDSGILKARSRLANLGIHARTPQEILKQIEEGELCFSE